MATFKKVEELKSELESILELQNSKDDDLLSEHAERYLSIIDLWFKESLKTNPFGDNSSLTEVEQNQLKSVLVELENLHSLACTLIEKRLK
jgi:hypothetical protein